MAPSKAQSRFQADLKSAAERNIPNVSDINKGDAEDEFTFVFTHSIPPDADQYEIRVQPQETRGYPDENTYLIYTNDDVPPSVAQVLEDSLFETSSMRIADMLNNISRRLRVALESKESQAEEDIEIGDADVSDYSMDDSDSEDVLFEYGDDDPNWSLRAVSPDVPAFLPMQNLSPSVMQRIRHDLHLVLKAGSHPWRICGFEEGATSNIISISTRVDRLGLSEEMREAWDIASSRYIVLLIHYEQRYTTFDDAMGIPAAFLNMRFCLRKSSEKKPSIQQAIAAFSSKSTGTCNRMGSGASEDSGLSHMLMSRSIDDLMNNEFVSLMKLRKQGNVSWTEAKERLRSQLNSGLRTSADLPDTDEDMQSATGQKGCVNQAQLPSPLTVDHLLSDEKEISLPLIATQFALHYLVRCTDYCTICHREMSGVFGAVRPYVCADPLCLHQYMNIGLGPSITHEIINQPNVVDLLISLCYASLAPSTRGCKDKFRIREFPRGLSLKVPNIRKRRPLDYEGRCVEINGGVLIDPVDAGFDWINSTATITGEYSNIGLTEGQWVIVATNSTVVDLLGTGWSSSLHCARIVSVTGNVLQLDVVAERKISDDHPPALFRSSEFTRQNRSSGIIPSHLVLYNKELDDLDTEEKAFSMMTILATLPSVAVMRSYLMSNQDRQLVHWNQMSRAAVDLLRWIIASNRSYIVQVDEYHADPTDATLARPHEKIHGVTGWIQFRFTQGSPEKEILFNEALQSVKDQKEPKTLVAWHGSSVANWHSILRQGLDFNEVTNGRSYGNGIYFARDFTTSYGYTGNYASISSANANLSWPQSALQVSYVVSLNELINCPEKFRSHNPFFVVQECHWTRCRYLFVQPASQNDSVIDQHKPRGMKTPTADYRNVPEFVQDRSLVATGPNGSQLFIPKGAIPSARGQHNDLKSPVSDGEPLSQGSEEEEGDLEFIYPENATDFRPGTLDYSKLPQLAPPSYATGAAQKALGQEIKKLQQVQATTPLHQLGWYIDFEKMNNMFQWIVELHSFDPNLPLAQDLKKAGLTSVVLEVRFLRGFPLSPPFVRVIRPKFLPFVNGGGGHVTAGGAMCMELLTNTGWLPSYGLESVFLQVRLAMTSQEPKPARLESSHHGQKQYGIAEAVDAYIRAAKIHGWEVPKDLHDSISH